MYASAERPERAMHLLEQVEMADQAYKLPRRSPAASSSASRSPGARQRPADPRGRRAHRQPRLQDRRLGVHLFEELVDAHKTIVMVTHDSDIASRVRRAARRERRGDRRRDGPPAADRAAGHLT
jgi:putative ABC transport system ATP-binding protein